MITAEEARRNGHICYEKALKDVLDMIDKGIRYRSLKNETSYVFAFQFKDIDVAKNIIGCVKNLLTTYGYTYDIDICNSGRVIGKINW